MMRALFTVSMVELFMGGGGRLTAIGPVSLRMVLFAICLCATVVAMLFPRRRSDGVRLAMGLVLAYLIIHVGALLVGSMYSGDTKRMFIEFQQSLYWLAAPFIALMIQTEKDVEMGARIVRKSGVALALIYLAVLAVLITGVVNVAILTFVVGPSGEFVFRSGEFFIYKGFLYLGIAIVFLVALRPRYWQTLVIAVFVATVLTFTRGFLVSTSVSILCMLFVQRRWNLAVPALALVLTAAFVILVYLPSTDESVGGHYEASTNQRFEDMNYIAQHMSPKTLLVGEGYASLINNRHQIENTFLNLWWKLGSIGLAFWLLPFGLTLYYYLRIPNRTTNALATAFMFGVLVVYIQSATNPFVNNPIGLSFTLLALFSLRVLSRLHTEVPAGAAAAAG
jgi:hypothetical protein